MPTNHLSPARPIPLQYQLGKWLSNTKTAQLTRLPVPTEPGFMAKDQLLVGRGKDGHWAAYDTVCDHHGGTLALDASRMTATCPLHKWTLRLDEGRYENHCPKKCWPVVQDKDFLCVTQEHEQFAGVDQTSLCPAPIDFDFNAHACVSMQIDGLRISTDPWLIGSCFATGWWHAFPPSQEAVERVQSSDLIYISHNHPDHLHLPTVKQFVRPDQCFVIPAFASGSVETMLRRAGFENLIVLDFLQELIVNTASSRIKLVLLKSGDQRDDSALLLYTQQHTVAFGVDSNLPNNNVLPKVDLLFSQFAGGASGFPARIENFETDKKLALSHTNKSNMLGNYVHQLVKACQPRYFVPYAGYFTESQRDSDVKAINLKNSAAQTIDYVVQNFPQIECLNPLETAHFSLDNKQLLRREGFETPLYFIDADYVEQDIQQFSAEFFSAQMNVSLFLKQLGEMFTLSKFTDDLTVIVVPCHDDFQPMGEMLLTLNFSASARGAVIQPWASLSNEQICQQALETADHRIELLRIRLSSLSAVLALGLPLEDLSIGFQVKMYRSPNVYNFRFWHHFTAVEPLTFRLNA